jgi:Tfp pilus assembly protein FimT
MELLVVVAILVVALAVAWPRLAALSPKARLDGAARNLAAEIQRARFRSIADGSRYRVTVNTGARSYQVCREPVSGSGNFTACDTARVIDETGSIAIATAPAAAATFNARGSCDPAIQVTLTAVTGEVRRVGMRRSGNVYVL